MWTYTITSQDEGYFVNFSDAALENASMRRPADSHAHAVAIGALGCARLNANARPRPLPGTVGTPATQSPEVRAVAYALANAAMEYDAIITAWAAGYVDGSSTR